MPKPQGPLPEEVRQALQRGSILDAVKLLTKSGGITLKQAKELIEAEARRAQAERSKGGQQGTRSHGAHPAPIQTQRLQPGAWPAAATEALRQGHKIEAIRIVREHTGMGLKEAKDAVESHEQTMVPTVEGLSPRNGLSPGEVPRTSGMGSWLLILLVIIAAVVYYLFRNPG